MANADCPGDSERRQCKCCKRRRRNRLRIRGSIQPRIQEDDGDPAFNLAAPRWGWLVALTIERNWLAANRRIRRDVRFGSIADISQGFTFLRQGKLASAEALRRGNNEIAGSPYVRFGSQGTFCDAGAMSTLPPKADIRSAKTDVSGHEQKGRPRGGLSNNVAYNGRDITSRRHFPCISPYHQHAHHFCSSRNLLCLFFWHQQVL